MNIIYGVVAYKNTVLAEHAAASGNFTEVTQCILDKIPSEGPSRMSYVYDRYLFHYIVDDGIVYLCMAESEFGRKIPFALLEDIKEKFSKKYSETAKTSPAFGMNGDFSKVLADRMKFFSDDRNVDKIAQVKGQINDVKQVMVQNIEKVLERNQCIDILVDKTENLNQNAFQFKNKSVQLRRALWWKNQRIVIFIGCVVVVSVAEDPFAFVLLILYFDKYSRSPFVFVFVFFFYFAPFFELKYFSFEGAHYNILSLIVRLDVLN
eukprot:Nk52_evm57s226 gene=Nk52_evmTU57s226